MSAVGHRLLRSQFQILEAAFTILVRWEIPEGIQKICKVRPGFEPRSSRMLDQRLTTEPLTTEPTIHPA